MHSWQPKHEGYTDESQKEALLKYRKCILSLRKWYFIASEIEHVEMFV